MHSIKGAQVSLKWAYILHRILGVPFWGLINIISIILYKDMHISTLQITAILALKPISALFSPYWSQIIYNRPERIVPNLVLSNILRYLPFLFLPWIESSWIVILAFGFYMMLYRGTIPVWLEAFKCNLPAVDRVRLVSYGSTIDYCGAALLPIILGTVLDGSEYAWRWLFPLCALLGLTSTFFVYLIPPIQKTRDEQPIPRPEKLLFSKKIVKPWKQSWELIKERSDFAHFQIGFMFGGAGLMLMQPALPIFFVDTLTLSYTSMLIAIAVCKGLGFVASSQVWTYLFRRWSIYYFSSIVTILAAAFPFLIIMTQYHVFLLYVAYGLYGVMQAGSELSWHMSGPVFSKNKDSSLFSGINVLSVGVRGCVAPFLGALLFSVTDSFVVLVLSACLCLMAAFYFLRCNRYYQHEIPANEMG